MNTQKVTLTFGKGTPPSEMYASTWFLIYQKLMKAKQGKWEYVEIPANKLKSALDSIRHYCRKHKIPVSLKVDKSKVDKGIGTIWYSRKAA